MLSDIHLNETQTTPPTHTPTFTYPPRSFSPTHLPFLICHLSSTAVITILPPPLLCHRTASESTQLQMLSSKHMALYPPRLPAGFSLPFTSSISFLAAA